MFANRDEGLEARFAKAVQIARALSGQVICVDGTFAALRSGELIFEAEENGIVEDERDTADRNRFVLEQRLQDASLAWEWVEAEGMLPPRSLVPPSCAIS